MILTVRSLRAAVLLVLLVVATLVTAALSAKPRRPMKVLGGDRALIESEDGDVLACLPSVEAGRARAACGLVDFRSGFITGISADTYFASVTRGRLTVSRATPGALDEAFAEPQQARPTFGAFVRHRSGRTLELRPTRRYGFSGTSLGCTVARSGLTVTCFLVDRRFRPLRSSYGFTLGFSALRVIRVDAAGKRTIVSEKRHRT